MFIFQTTPHGRSRHIKLLIKRLINSKQSPGTGVGITSVLIWVRLVRWMWPVWFAQYSQSLSQSRSNDRMPSSAANSSVSEEVLPWNSNKLTLLKVQYKNLGSAGQKVSDDVDVCGIISKHVTINVCKWFVKGELKLRHAYFHTSHQAAALWILDKCRWIPWSFL